ncbi:hypothetical protein ABZ070_07710 [Streptomyces sp. NPDC006283]|uniref:hypothetical protein n=1 Tax=Streptomyces sp. NPDC006283 TaxID=3156741 RepID=UPI0033B2A847
MRSDPQPQRSPAHRTEVPAGPAAGLALVPGAVSFSITMGFDPSMGPFAVRACD